MALLEANLDFAHESDVADPGRAALAHQLLASARTVASLIERLARRDRPASSPRVVICGPPNAGKSRLFNALLGDERAIVAPTAGTTRDYLSAACDVGGLIVELVDTAGEEVPRGSVESWAQQHRAEQAGLADLVLVCRAPDSDNALEAQPRANVPMLRVLTKCDMGWPAREATPAAIVTSAATGEGLAALRAAICRAVGNDAAEHALPSSTSARCRESLEGASYALDSAARTLQDRGGDELVAADLRLALDELGEVTGAVVTDDILDRIFQRFCIGK